MTATFLVFLGAGLGGVLRHGVNLAALKWLGAPFPYGTMAINIVGSGLMGLIAGWFAFRAGEGWSQHLRLFLTTESSAASPPSRRSRSTRCCSGSAAR